MTQSEYREAFSQLTFDTFQEHCPDSNLMSRLIKMFPGGYKEFVSQIDFVAFEFPLHPSLFTSDHWMMLADYLSELKTDQVEYQMQRRYYQ